MRTVAVTWETAHQHGEAWISHHRLRYKMFVERQRWSVPSYRQIEYDEFDTPAATYILTVDEQHRALGSVRLIPTTRPYMVESLWPDLVSTELPHCGSVWEASRFRLRPRPRRGQSAACRGAADPGMPRVWNCNWHLTVSRGHAGPNFQIRYRSKRLPRHPNRTNAATEWTRNCCCLYRCIAVDIGSSASSYRDPQCDFLSRSWRSSRD